MHFICRVMVLVVLPQLKRVAAISACEFLHLAFAHRNAMFNSSMLCQSEIARLQIRRSVCFKLKLTLRGSRPRSSIREQGCECYRWIEQDIRRWPCSCQSRRKPPLRAKHQRAMDRTIYVRPDTPRCKLEISNLDAADPTQTLAASWI